jgi:protein involved in polysaccharide export with SLBB domain
MKTIREFLIFFSLATMAVLGLRAADSPTDDVELVAGDKILFSIKEDPKPGPATEAVVFPRGDFSVPVSAAFQTPQITLNVKGKTLSQLQAELKTKLEKDYYKVATVRLELKDRAARPSRVTFSGAIKGSGILQFNEGEKKQLYDALMEVQPSEFANLSKVKISRVNPKTGQREMKEYNMSDVAKSKKGAVDPYLENGDRIEVPEKGLVNPFTK